MPNKTNEELGIYKINVELSPIIRELQTTNELDLRALNHTTRSKLGVIAKRTELIEYVPIIRRKVRFTIISENKKEIIVKKENKENV